MSHPTEPYEPVDDHTVMRPPRTYGPDGAPGPADAAPRPSAYGPPHAQVPYGTDPYGRRPPVPPPPGHRGPDPHATLPPAETGATWPPAGTAPGAPYGYTAPGRTAPGHAPTGPVYGTPDDATVVPAPPGPPADPYGFSPYARPPRASRPWLVPVLAGVGAFVVVAGGIGLWLGLRDDAPPASGPTTAEPAPVTSGAPAQPEESDEAEPAEDPVDTDVTDDEPWLEQQYRAGAEMDPETGPALSPMSWDYFGDNDYLVNEDRIALTARRDFACDDLPVIPAVQVLADVCEGGGFEARVVSHDGPTVALDVVVLDVGSKEEAERAAAAFNDAAAGDPIVDTSGAAHPTLAAAVPQPGFQGSYALLDDGDVPAVMVSTGTVVMLYRLGIDDGVEREQLLPVAQAVGLVITDHEIAKSFDEKKWAKTKAG